MDKKYIVLLSQVIAISFSINIITGFPKDIIIGSILLLPSFISIYLSTKTIEHLEDKHIALSNLDTSLENYNEQKNITVEIFNKKINSNSIPAYILVLAAILVFSINSYINNNKNITPDYFETFQKNLINHQNNNYNDFLILRDITIILKNETIKELNEKCLTLKKNIDSLEKVKK